MLQLQWVCFLAASGSWLVCSGRQCHSRHLHSSWVMSRSIVSYLQLRQGKAQPAVIWCHLVLPPSNASRSNAFPAQLLAETGLS